MRLIDADALKQFEISFLMSDGYGYADVVYAGYIHNAPTIDAVPVVRCKDCTEFSDDDEEDGWGFCNNTGVGMERDGFCSCGERKDDG